MLYHHEPREVILSQHTEFRLIRGQNRLQLVKESFQYVPILETLKALLNQPDVLAEVYQLVSHVHIARGFLFCYNIYLTQLPFT